MTLYSCMEIDERLKINELIAQFSKLEKEY